MGDLRQSFSETELDLENNSPRGFQILDTITEYPATSTGTPTPEANPGAPKNFYQSYIPTRTYLDTINRRGSNFLNIGSDEVSTKDIFDATNLDISKPGVDGGIPYNELKDPTVYPITSNKVAPNRGYFATPGSPASKFNQLFLPTNTYLDFINDYI